MSSRAFKPKESIEDPGEEERSPSFVVLSHLVAMGIGLIRIYLAIAAIIVWSVLNA